MVVQRIEEFAAASSNVNPSGLIKKLLLVQEPPQALPSHALHIFLTRSIVWLGNGSGSVLDVVAARIAWSNDMLRGIDHEEDDLLKP